MHPLIVRFLRAQVYNQSTTYLTTYAIMGNRFLQTKFHIPAKRAVDVTRLRLLDTLRAGLDTSRKLTLLSAPAGYGKTTLIADWLHRLPSDHHTAWLSLDEKDNDLTRFLGYWLELFGRMDETVGQDARNMLGVMQVPSTASILDALINELAAAELHMIVILDDYHLITNPAVHDALEYFLTHQPSHLHVVITTREDPPLSLARMRARGQMTEIRAHDLRFTLEEATHFFNQSMQLDLNRATIDAIEAQTEGWAAGLQLAALAMQNLSDQHEFVSNFSGNHRYVIDYLLDEVLKQQTPEIRDFLSKTAVLKRFNAELCQAVTENTCSASILSQLERSNLFLIPLDDQRGWYRYHHLFSDALRVGLPAEIETEIQKCAALWFEKQELLEEAIPYWLAVPEPQNAARLIAILATDMIRNGEFRTLLSWLDRLPGHIVITSADLASYKALALLLTGQLTPVQDYLAQISESAYQSRPADQGRLFAIQAWIGMTSGDASSGKIASDALDRLDKEDSYFRLLSLLSLGNSLAWDANLPDSSHIFREAYDLGRQLKQSSMALGALANLAFNLLEQGQLREADSMCRAALEIFVDARGKRLPVLGIIYIPLAYICYEQGKLDEAQLFAQQGIELCQRLFSSAIMGGDAEIVLARIALELGCPAEAFALLESTAQAARQHNLPMVVFKMTIVETELRLLQDQVQEAEIRLQELETLVQSGLPKGGQIVAHLRARYWVASGHPEKALPILDQMERSNRSEQCFRRLIGVHITQAMAYQKQGKDSQAAAAFASALLLAAPEGYQTVFIPHPGRPSQRLLQNSRTLAPGFVNEILQKTTPADEPVPHLIDPLSEQEIRVFKLIVAGKSNQEIASELTISPGTAKWHVHNILQKLGVSNRAQAIVRARELGI